MKLAAHHDMLCGEFLAYLDAPAQRWICYRCYFPHLLDRHQTVFALGEALAHLHYLEGRGMRNQVPGPDGIDRFVGHIAL